MSHTETSAPRRRPIEGGYARGEETRARIVQAALEVFAADGFGKASTRRIALRAGVNPPALQYYFDSKEGLHRACAELIIEQVSRTLDPALKRGGAVLAADDPELALDALCDLVDVLADLSITTRDTPPWRRFIAQAQGDDAGPAYQLIKAALSEPMLRLVRALVAQVVVAREDDEEVRLRAHLLVSQLSSFHQNRDYTLRALGWSDLGFERLALIKGVARSQTRAALLDARAANLAVRP